MPPSCRCRSGPMFPAKLPRPKPITIRYGRRWPWCRRDSRTSSRHPALRYGMALNDAGYFWEAQEILEAVWAAAPQGGRERILLRACIQIANANLRLRLQKPRAAARFFGEELSEIEILRANASTAVSWFADT